jgi:hypothetical protein
MAMRLPALCFALLAALPLAAAAAGPATIPEEFRGRWNLNQGRCASDTGDARLEVGARQVRYYESEGPVLAVRRLDQRTIQLTVQLSGEGETERRQLTFQLSQDGQRLTDRMDPPFTRVRCR